MKFFLTVWTLEPALYNINDIYISPFVGYNTPLSSIGHILVVDIVISTGSIGIVYSIGALMLKPLVL